MSGSKAPPDSYEWNGDSARPEFDEALAQSYVGRTIIVGLTYLNQAGEFVEQRQFHGEIVSASGEGIVIALAGNRAGEYWTMPPSLESVRNAAAGEYRLRETGEVIVDPDLMVTWTINAPANH